MNVNELKDSDFKPFIAPAKIGCDEKCHS